MQDETKRPNRSRERVRFGSSAAHTDFRFECTHAQNFLFCVTPLEKERSFDLLAIPLGCELATSSVHVGVFHQHLLHMYFSSAARFGGRASCSAHRGRMGPCEAEFQLPG